MRKKWWATLESNQACVSARELQSPATPCGLSPTFDFLNLNGCLQVTRKEVNDKNAEHLKPFT